MHARAMGFARGFGLSLESIALSPLADAFLRKRKPERKQTVDLGFFRIAR
jgi:hypothetical protein